MCGDRPAHGADRDDDALGHVIASLRRAFDAPLSAEQARAVADLAERAALAIRHGRSVDALASSRDTLRVDLEAQARAIRRLARERAQTRRVLAAAGAGLWECRLSDERLEWSREVYDLFGFGPGTRLHREDTLGCYMAASRVALDEARSGALANGGAFRIDSEIETAKGERRWIRLNGVAELERGQAVRLYGVKQDVTEERAEIQSARRLAEQDALTGLANRRLFEDTLATLSADRDAALALIDLDGFKQVNDTFGHLTGDECLKEVARRLAAAARGATLVARTGGDEFAVLFDRGLSRSEINRRMRRIVEALRVPVSRGDFLLEIGASAGVALSDGGPAAAWSARADLALYAAKSAGRGAFRNFDPAMTAHSASAFDAHRLAV